eukprot:1485423-Prymnesium_polylepis.1
MHEPSWARQMQPLLSFIQRGARSNSTPQGSNGTVWAVRVSRAEGIDSRRFGPVVCAPVCPVAPACPLLLLIIIT